MCTVQIIYHCFLKFEIFGRTHDHNLYWVRYLFPYLIGRIDLTIDHLDHIDPNLIKSKQTK